MSHTPEASLKIRRFIIAPAEFMKIARSTRDRSIEHRQRMDGWANSYLENRVLNRNVTETREAAIAGVNREYHLALSYLNASREAALRVIAGDMVELVQAEKGEIFANPIPEHTEPS